jgi:4-hydroxybutyrate dehydrogenase/sulfolactaldehyde 3-reductase
MHKDLTYSSEEAARAGVPLRTAETARELYTAAMAQGWGDKDFSAIVEPLRGAAERVRPKAEGRSGVRP